MNLKPILSRIMELAWMYGLYYILAILYYVILIVASLIIWVIAGIIIMLWFFIQMIIYSMIKSKRDEAKQLIKTLKKYPLYWICDFSAIHRMICVKCGFIEDEEG
jgi:hypothetical protein